DLDGERVVPCPWQTHGVTCRDCRLCWDDQALLRRGHTIGFELHGSGRPAARLALTLIARTGDARMLEELTLDGSHLILSFLYGIMDLAFENSSDAFHPFGDAAMAVKTVCPLTPAEFEKDAQPLDVKVGQVGLTADPRPFSSGSFGWGASQKVVVE